MADNVTMHIVRHCLDSWRATSTGTFYAWQLRAAFPELHLVPVNDIESALRRLQIRRYSIRAARGRAADAWQFTGS